MDDILKIAANSFVTAMRGSLPPSVYNALCLKVGLMAGLEAQKTQPPDDTVPIRLLRPIFEWLDKGEAAPKEAGYAYPFAPMAADSIFPRQISGDNTNNLQESYNSFFNEFQSALKGLQHKDPRTSHLWFENFESLMMLYMSALPASQATDAAGSDFPCMIMPVLKRHLLLRMLYINAKRPHPHLQTNT